MKSRPVAGLSLRGALRVCAAIALATLLVACGLFVDEAKLLARAQEAHQKGDLRAAAIDLKKLLQDNPKSLEARLELGIVDLETGDATTAIRELERVRAEGMASNRVAEPLARAYQSLKKYDEALKILDEAIAGPVAAGDAKNRAAYLRMRGDIHLAKQSYAEARNDFEASLVEQPLDVRSMLGLVAVAEATEGPKAALAMVEKVIEKVPNEPLAHIVHGGHLIQARQPQAAVTAFQKALELADKPGGGRMELLSALSGLSQAQIASGQIEEALKTTERMEKFAPNVPLVRFARAYALAQHGEFEAARALLEQNVAKSDDPRSQMLLGAINISLGRYAQAEMQLSAIVAASPSNAEARQLLAQARLHQSKPSDALDTLLPAISNDANASSSLLALAGQASLASGKIKEGVALLKRNVDAHPEDITVQLDLAAGYLAAGQSDQALAVLGGGPADKGQSVASANETEAQMLRREYLAVLAQLQKGDEFGAVNRAVKAAQSDPKNASLQMLASAVLAKQRQFDRSMPFAEAVVKLRPNDANGYTNLGRLNLAQRNVDAARENFQKALKLEPGDPVAATSLALLELSAAHSDVALAVLSEFRKHNTDSIEPRVLEAQLLLSRGKLEDAEKLARATVEKANDNASALAVLGRVLSTQNRHAEALQVFERAVRAQPKSAPLRFQMALAQRGAGKVDDAMESLRETLKIDEHFVPGLQLAGLMSVAKGDLTTATKYAETLLKSAPDQAATHELLGQLRSAQNRFDEAAREFRKAGELSPQPQFAVAEFEARTRGKLAEPEEPLQRYLKAYPKEPSVRVALAMSQQARGARDDAARSYEEVLSNSPKHPIALNNLAWIRHQDGKADALDLARRAYEVAPQSTAIVDTYAWILVNSGKVAEALKLLEPIAGTASKDQGKSTAADVRAHYAIVLARSGRVAEAKALAKDLTTSNSPDLSVELRGMLADLAKS
jgi:putative PEP-CTERM system TPR-repeat lipoprotein